MLFHRHAAPAGNIVASCDDAGVVVGGVRYECSLLITPEKLQKWRPAAAGDIGEEDLQNIADMGGGGEVVLLGAGGNIRPKPEWLAFFAARKMALETMPLKAACRTYSVLTTDARP
ncbi:MAG: MTH938/NDUFAF3 family protein, partial [Gammaproteobacteria bacterium]